MFNAAAQTHCYCVEWQYWILSCFTAYVRANFATFLLGPITFESGVRERIDVHASLNHNAGDGCVTDRWCWFAGTSRTRSWRRATWRESSLSGSSMMDAGPSSSSTTVAVRYAHLSLTSPLTAHGVFVVISSSVPTCLSMCVCPHIFAAANRRATAWQVTLAYTARLQ